jgi:hypothetical protein
MGAPKLDAEDGALRRQGGESVGQRRFVGREVVERAEEADPARDLARELA